MSSPNFWSSLPCPILALAPMAGVTDLAFRSMCKRFGADVVYTEFASVDALIHGNQATRDMIKFRNEDQPVVVQIFGNSPEKFAQASKILEDMGFAGIDINFGCPAYKVVKNGGGVSLMRNLPLCRELVQAACEAVKIPISIKIRSSIKSTGDACEIDYNVEGTEHGTPPLTSPPSKGGDTQKLSSPYEWEARRGFGVITALDMISAIKGLPVSAVMIHARSYEKPFDGTPDMNMITEVKKLFPGIVLGNGGVYSPELAKEMIESTGCDGIGIGRGCHGAPWIFTLIRSYLAQGTYQPLSWDEKKAIILDHAKLALESKGEHGIIELRKHLMWYVKGIPGASELRQQLAHIHSIDDVNRALEAIVLS